MARRAVQPVLPGVAVLCLAYGFFGQYLPGALGHPALPVDYFLGRLTLAEGGLWGQLTGISIDLIVPFMILGAVVSARSEEHTSELQSLLRDSSTVFCLIKRNIDRRYLTNHD